jgi:membrane protein involved in D-alanine export
LPFYAAIGLALLPLAGAKLVPLVAPASRLGFLGISYATFRSLDVIIGIRDRLLAALPVGDYFAYLLFFPTLSSGPIDRFRRFQRDWRRTRTRAEFLSDLDGAVQRIFRGFLYKFILAALVEQYWLPRAAGTGLLQTTSYMYGYTAYLFFDFAGYSAFAIGLSYIFGIHTPENFDRPFLARNIAEFWNRWHITLSSWFRDHVYMRFVIAALRHGRPLDRRAASYAGFVIAFGLMGLWHGLERRYILYGLYHAALLIGHDRFRKRGAGGRADDRLQHAVAVVVTFHCVAFGFLLFSGRLL